MLKYSKGDSIINIPVKLKTRGHFRKNRSICSFPPIKIKFDKELCKGSIFNNQGKLKIVSHCRKDNKRYQQMLFQEYLIYKAYSILTPESFKVKLALITYTDSENKVNTISEYAFFIESFKALAKRNRKIRLHKKKIHQENTILSKITRLALFQYMIGNTDWGVPTLHNIKLITKTSTSRAVAVPYDFDWASFVNAPYAVPNSKFELKDIHQRLYRGFKRTSEELISILKEFKMKKHLFYNLYKNTNLLNPSEKNRILDDLDDFYEIINDKRLIKHEFIDLARHIEFKHK